jgi:hypothetical protein
MSYCFGLSVELGIEAYEYYNNSTYVLHCRTSHCLLEARQSETIPGVALQAPFLPHILTFIA